MKTIDQERLRVLLHAMWYLNKCNKGYALRESEFLEGMINIKWIEVDGVVVPPILVTDLGTVFTAESFDELPYNWRKE